MPFSVMSLEVVNILYGKWEATGFVTICQSDHILHRIISASQLQYATEPLKLY